MIDYNTDIEERVIQLEEEVEKRNDAIIDLLHVYRSVNAAISIALANTHMKDAEIIFKRYEHTLREWSDSEGMRPLDSIWADDLFNVDNTYFPYLENVKKLIEE